jgi:hypothetical protein
MKPNETGFIIGIIIVMLSLIFLSFDVLMAIYFLLLGLVTIIINRS